MLDQLHIIGTNDSRKVLIEQYPENPHDYNMFHNIIGFKNEKPGKGSFLSIEFL